MATMKFIVLKNKRDTYEYFYKYYTLIVIIDKLLFITLIEYLHSMMKGHD